MYPLEFFMISISLTHGLSRTPTNPPAVMKAVLIVVYFLWVNCVASCVNNWWNFNQYCLFTAFDWTLSKEDGISFWASTWLLPSIFWIEIFLSAAYSVFLIHMDWLNNICSGIWFLVWLHHSKSDITTLQA